MASPRPFFPLQQPVNANLMLPLRLSERRAPALRPPRAHTAPAAFSAPAVRALFWISPSPARSAAPPRSLHTTSLPGPAESGLSGTALPSAAVPHPLAAALPG